MPKALLWLSGLLLDFTSKRPEPGELQNTAKRDMIRTIAQICLTDLQRDTIMCAVAEDPKSRSERDTLLCETMQTSDSDLDDQSEPSYRRLNVAYL